MENTAYRLYGRQKSRPLTAAQQELMDQLLPNVDVDIQELTKAKRAVLEIGFGSGEHLAAKAMAHPDTLHIGCEPFKNGVAALLHAIDENHTKNIRIHHADVRKLYDELPDSSFDEIYLLFPDPWPKKRHWKRRFIQNHTFVEMQRLLKPNGKWFIATDHASYQLWIEEILTELPATTLFTHTNSTNASEAWKDFTATRYQQKAFREGRTPRYYTLESKKNTDTSVQDKAA